MPNPLLIRHAEQPSFWLLRDCLKPLLDGSHTNGQISMAVNRIHPGDGPPPHLHRNEDEGFYILEGEVTFLFRDQLIVAKPGDFVWAPRNIIHCFKCTSATPAKFVLLVTPTKFMDFARTLAKPAPDFMQPPVLTEADIGQLMSVTPQYGIEMKLDHVMPATVAKAAGPLKQLWVMGLKINFLATRLETGGQFTIVEVGIAPHGDGPPPHAHVEMDELFYVIEGQVAFVIGDQTQIASPGDAVFIPHGTRHTFANVGDTPARLIDIHTPGGFEDFFEEFGVDALRNPVAPPLPEPPPPHVMAALFAKHGMTL